MSKRAVLLALICSSLCAVAGAANSVAPLQNGDSDNQPEAAEVTVQAHKEKMAKLRLQIKKSVDDFYAAFNKANTVPEYKTHCADERPTGSLIASHVCRPRLVDDANDQETQASVFFDNHATVPAYALIFLRMRGYRKQVEALIHNDPDVRQAALHFEALNEQYTATSREKVKPN